MIVNDYAMAGKGEKLADRAGGGEVFDRLGGDTGSLGPAGRSVRRVQGELQASSRKPQEKTCSLQLEACGLQISKIGERFFCGWLYL